MSICLSVVQLVYLSVAPGYIVCLSRQGILYYRGPIFDYWDSLFGQGKNIALCLKMISKTLTAFEFGCTLLQQILQNVWLINTHILIYWHVRCNCELWKALWFYCVFWVFSYFIDEFSCLKYCIFTKLLQIVCLINVNILVCQNAKCGYIRLWMVFSF